MVKQTKSSDQNQIAPARKLSLWRIFAVILILSFAVYTSYLKVASFKETKELSSQRPWFAPYVDVTAMPTYHFEQIDPEKTRNLMLAFVVGKTGESCTPTWGTYYSMDEASQKLDLDRRIARYRQVGGKVAISFGGVLNSELGLSCKDEDELYDAYKSVISRYEVETLDFDLEGESLKDKESITRRAKVLAKLQKDFENDDKKIAVWLTLPVTSTGLTPEGTEAVSLTLKEGVNLAGLNVMTMNYGDSKGKNESMFEASKRALTETHRQLGILLRQAGINLSDATLWLKIGATPMIGQNDIVNEIFTLDDAKNLNQFAVENGMVRMSMWSLNRDIICGGNYVNLTVVSDSCSGMKQDKLGFSQVLAAGFDGDIVSNSNRVVEENSDATQKADDPATSPYQIWSERGTYLQGTKVVWHGNVYEAKWWTRGDLPDNPVLQSWETPWQLVGPVLPDEKPIPQPTLPPGTYPEWSGTEIYNAGQRVLFNGSPYEAKWWTQGDSPAAASSNPDSSPWILLTQKQIEEILN